MKRVIAVDIDDVLAASVKTWVRYSNERWGTKLSVEDYEEDWAKTWGVDYEEAERRAAELHKSGLLATYGHFAEAHEVLSGLSRRFKLIVTSARIEDVRAETLAWLDDNYGGIFEEVHLAGFYDKGPHKDAVRMTKAGLLKSLGAGYLIDDQPKHCLAAAEADIEAVLFGNYSWNRDIGRLPAGVTRCADWAAVKEFFDKIA